MLPSFPINGYFSDSEERIQTLSIYMQVSQQLAPEKDSDLQLVTIGVWGMGREHRGRGKMSAFGINTEGERDSKESMCEPTGETPYF